MASTDKAKIELTAEVSEFNSAIKSAKSSITELNSELRLNQTQMNTSGTSTQQLESRLKTLQEKSKALEDEEEALRGKLEKTVDVYGENSTEAQKLQTQINNVQTQEARCEQEIQSTTEALEAQRKADEQSNSELGKLTTTISNQERELSDLKTQYTNVVLEEGKDSEAAQELAGKITNLNGELQDNKTKLNEAEKAADDLTKSEEDLGDEAEDAGNKGADGFKAMYDAIVAAGLIEAVKKLVSAIKECVEVAADFQSQMSTVQALSGATADEMDELTAAAKQMGATTSFTATQAGEAMEYMALAGWSTEEMMEGLDGIINLAAASGEDLGSTCDIVTDALTAFGMSASDSAHFADVLAAASANSNTTVSQMGEAFKQTATTAGTLGYSIDDVSVALGLMADNGIKGSSAGSALSTALTRMSGTSTSATKELEKLGVSMYDDQHNTKDLASFLGELRTALKNNYTNADELQVALYNLAGQRGMKGLAAIVNSTDEDFAALTESISTCSGTAEEMAEIKLDNFEGQVTLLKSAWDGLMTTMGDAALGALTSIVEVFTDIVGAIGGFLDQHEALAKAIDALIAGVLVATAGLVAMGIAVSDLGNKFVELTAKMADFPLGLLAVAITGIVTAFVAFVAMMQDTEDESDILRKKTASLAKEVRDLNDAYNESEIEQEENASNYRGLVNEMNNLLGTTNRTAAEQERLESIIEILNEYLGEGALYYDKEADSVVVLGGAVGDLTEDLVEEQINQDAANAASEQANELYEKRYEVMDTLEELERQRADLQQELIDNERIYADNEEELARANDAVYASLVPVNDEIETNKNTLAKLDDQLGIVEDTINDYAETTEEEFASSTSIVQDAVTEMCNQIVELNDAYNEAYDAAKDSLEGQFSLWETAEEVIPKSAEEVIKAIESQTTNLETYSAQMQELLESDIEGMDDFVAHYSDGSQESMIAIATMAEADEDERKAMIAAMEGWSDAADENASIAADAQTKYTDEVDQLIQEIIEDYGDLEDVDLYAVGIETMEGYTMAIQDEEGNIVDVITGVGEEAIERFNEACGVDSPSWKTQETGEDTIQGYINGVDDMTGDATGAMSDLGEDVLNAYNDWCNATALVDSGTDTIQSYVDGVNKKSKDATKAMSGLATDSINAWDRIDNSNSLISSGQDTILGFMTGTNNKQSSMTSKMNDIAKAGLTNFQNIATSTALTATGQNTLIGFSNGAVNQQSSLNSKLSTLASNAMTSFKNNATSNTLYSSGQNVIQGAMNGADSKSSSFGQKLSNIASNAMSKFKKALGVSSPSWIAEEDLEYFAEGAIIGIEDSEKPLADAMTALGQGATDAFNLDNADVDISRNVKTNYQDQMQDYVETMVMQSIAGLATQIADMADEIASRPIYVQINGKTFVAATVGDTDTALGTRQALTARGLSL